MKRRGFIASLIAGVMSVFVSKNKIEAADSSLTSEWVKGQLIGDWRVRRPELPRCWRPENVAISEWDGGFLATVQTEKRTYRILVGVFSGRQYIGCATSNIGDGNWSRCNGLDGQPMSAWRSVWHSMVWDNWSTGHSHFSEGPLRDETWQRLVWEIALIEIDGVEGLYRHQKSKTNW